MPVRNLPTKGASQEGKDDCGPDPEMEMVRAECMEEEWRNLCVPSTATMIAAVLLGYLQAVGVYKSRTV